MGLALVEDGVLLWTKVWMPSNKKANAQDRLHEFHEWLHTLLGFIDVDFAVVELVASQRNTNTVRVLSRYEAAAHLALSRRGIEIVSEPARVKTARMHALGKGNGNLGKPEVYKMVCEMLPDHDFKPFKKGGGDETDAYVLAIAGPALRDS